MELLVKFYPWILAVIGAASALITFNKNKKNNVQINDNVLGICAAVGMIGGYVLGMLVKAIGVGVGVSLGMLWGLNVGMMLGSKK